MRCIKYHQANIATKQIYIEWVIKIKIDIVQLGILSLK